MLELKTKIGDLLEERATLVTSQREILDTAESERRELTAEDRQAYDRQGDRITEVEGDIRRYEAQERSEAFKAERGAEPSLDEPEGTTAERGRDSDEYRDAFNAYARGEELTDEQRSTLNVAEDREGGFGVPEAWTTLHESLREAGTIRNLATVIATEGGGTLHVPRVSAEADAPDLVREEERIPDDGQTFDEVLIGAIKLARTTKSSEEMVQDALFDVAGFVGGRIGFDLGRAANVRYVSGAGTGGDAPQGLFTGATVGVRGASADTISLDEVIDLLYSVIGPYRANGVFLATDSTHAVLRKLKDGNRQYLWQPSVQAGQPDMLLGKPVYADPDVDAIGADKRPLGFGDVKRSYLVRDVLGVVVKFLDQAYADDDQVGWRGKLRTSGAIVDQAAFKVLETSAS